MKEQKATVDIESLQFDARDRGIDPRGYDRGIMLYASYGDREMQRKRDALPYAVRKKGISIFQKRATEPQPPKLPARTVSEYQYEQVKHGYDVKISRPIVHIQLISLLIKMCLS